MAKPKQRRFTGYDRLDRLVAGAGADRVARALRLKPGTIKTWVRRGKSKFTNERADRVSAIAPGFVLRNRIARLCNRITQAEFARLAGVPASTVSGWLNRGYIPIGSYNRALDAAREVEDKLKKKPTPRGAQIVQLGFATGKDGRITDAQFSEMAKAIERGEPPKTKIQTDFDSVAANAYADWRALGVIPVNERGDALRKPFGFDEAGHRILGIAFLHNLRLMLDKIERSDIPILARREVDPSLIVGERNSASCGTNDAGQLWGLVSYCDPENGLPQDTFAFLYRDSGAVPGAYIIELCEIGSGATDPKSGKKKSESGQASRLETQFPEWDEDFEADYTANEPGEETNDE